MCVFMYQSVEFRIRRLYLLQRCKTSPKMECPEYDTKQYLMVKLGFWRPKECTFLLH